MAGEKQILNELTENEALATIIRHTKKRRTVTRPLEVAEACAYLRDLYGSITDVSRKTSFDSPEMIRQFVKINTLPKKVKDLTREGLITGVDILYRISKLDSETEKIELANAITTKNLTSNDVRSILNLKKKRPDFSVQQSIQRVLESKPCKVDIHKIITILEKDTFQKLEAYAENSRSSLVDLISKIMRESTEIENIESIKVHSNRVVAIELTENDYRKLEKKIEKLNVPTELLLDKIVKDWLTEKK